MNKKRFAIIVIFVACIFCVFSQSVLATKYLNAANAELDKKNYREAYKYINTCLAQYPDQDSVPVNIVIFGNTIYKNYLSVVKEQNDIATFREIQTNLKAFTCLGDDDISRLVATIDAQFADVARERELQVSRDNAKEVAKATSDSLLSATESLSQQLQNSIEMQNKSTSEAIFSANRDLASQLQDSLKQQSQSNQELLTSVMDDSNTRTSKLVWLFIIIFVFLVIIVVVVIAITIRLSRKQQEMFTQTLRVVSEMQRIPFESTDSLRLADIYSGMRALEDANASSRDTSKLKDFEVEEVDDLLRTELRELATACEEQGMKIDKATGRKNNSKNVAELVFKIAQSLGLGEYKSMLYFCAAMVYDIGFLQIDPTLLSKDSLSEDQKYKIRSHVRFGMDMLDFVPDKFRPVFLEATLMHHENLDGTGYPDGLRTDQIPSVARIIRVVESFIAQISKRNYRGIFDKETAISELRSKPEWYDQEIVETLDKLI